MGGVMYPLECKMKKKKLKGKIPLGKKKPPKNFECWTNLLSIIFKREISLRPIGPLGHSFLLIPGPTLVTGLFNSWQSQSGVEKKHVAVLRLMRKCCPVSMKLPALSTPLFTCLIQLPVNVTTTPWTKLPPLLPRRHAWVMSYSDKNN